MTVNNDRAQQFRTLLTRFQLLTEASFGPQSTEPGYGDESGGDSEATQQAHNLGLVSKGWGRWADPKTGNIVAKTIQGKLVKLDAGQGAVEDDSDDYDAEPDYYGQDAADFPSLNAARQQPRKPGLMKTMVNKILGRGPEISEPETPDQIVRRTARSDKQGDMDSGMYDLLKNDPEYQHNDAWTSMDGPSGEPE